MERYFIILACSLSILFLSNTSFGQAQYTVEKLSSTINTREYGEMCPEFYKNGIVFCSDRKNDVLVSYSDTSETPRKLFDLYFSELKENNKWTAPQIFSQDLNSLFQEGPASFFNEDKEVAYTRSLENHKKFGNYYTPGNYLGIFFATFDGTWKNIVPFEYNSKEYNVMDPTLTSDGKTMYFASNMPGGYGGFDIYVTTFKNNKWTKPVNLGASINSDKDEAFPFIHKSGRLFFASKGWNSKGGFDIFFSYEIDGKWIVPQNMKEPINGIYDDFGFVADEYLQSGYFSTLRNKSDDIYSFKSVISEFVNCTPQKKNTYCYVFREKGTSETDVTGSMKYEWDFGDGTKVRALEGEHCYAKKGKYIVKLNVIDSLTGEVYFSQAQYEHEVEDYEQPFVNAPEFAVAGSTIKLDAKMSNLKNFRTANYYWDFGDGFTSLGSEVQHIFYQEGVFDIKLQAASVPGRNNEIKKVCVFKSIVVKAP
jgi:hypothetical protein